MAKHKYACSACLLLLFVLTPGLNGGLMAAEAPGAQGNAAEASAAEATRADSSPEQTIEKINRVLDARESEIKAFKKKLQEQKAAVRKMRLHLRDVDAGGEQGAAYAAIKRDLDAALRRIEEYRADLAFKEEEIKKIRLSLRNLDSTSQIRVAAPSRAVDYRTLLRNIEAQGLAIEEIRRTLWNVEMQRIARDSAARHRAAERARNAERSRAQGRAASDAQPCEARPRPTPAWQNIRRAFPYCTARDFLLIGQAEDPEYGLKSYVIITISADASSEMRQRLEALYRAYLAVIKSTTAEMARAGVDKGDINATYWPLSLNQAQFEGQRAKKMPLGVDHYNHALVEKWLRQSLPGLEGKGPFIVASHHTMDQLAKMDKRPDLLALDLTKIHRDLFNDVFVIFKKRVCEVPATWQDGFKWHQILELYAKSALHQHADSVVQALVYVNEKFTPRSAMAAENK